MKKYLLIYSVLFLFVHISSCNGQEKTNVLQDSTIQSITIPIPTPPQENQPTDQNLEIPWLDPLFFIDGQLCAWVRNIFQDKSGNLWFGTNHYGVMRYNASPADRQGVTLEYFDENDGLGIGRITGIVEDQEGNVWFGTYGGLTKYDGKLFTNFSEKDGLVNNDIWSLIIDRSGIFWIGTAEGVSRFDGEVFTTFSLPQPAFENRTSHISPNRVSCIMEDKKGNFWFGTDGFGICKYDGKTFAHFTKENGFIDDNISGFMEDKKGNIWIGTMYGGVSMYDPAASGTSGKTFTNFTEDGVIGGIEVGGFYEDKIGNIWFAAENFGVYRYDGKSFTNLYEKEGLVTNGILSIFEDKEGRFWFGGWGGLFRFDGKSFFPVTKDGPWQ